jgi:hypothetical protein
MNLSFFKYEDIVEHIWNLRSSFNDCEEGKIELDHENQYLITIQE